MSRTLLIILIAIAIVVFVLSRFMGSGMHGTAKPASRFVDDSEFSTWVSFSPENQSFSVLLPREPDHVAQNSSDLLNRYLKRYDIYATNGLDSKGYMVQEISFLKGPTPDQDAQSLKNTLNDIVSSTQANIADLKEDQKFLGNNALLFEIDNAEKRTKGVMFVNNKKMYILSRTGGAGAHDEKDYQYFIDSFRLHNPPAHDEINDEAPQEKTRIAK